MRSRDAERLIRDYPELFVAALPLIAASGTVVNLNRVIEIGIVVRLTRCVGGGSLACFLARPRDIAG